MTSSREPLSGDFSLAASVRWVLALVLLLFVSGPSLAAPPGGVGRPVAILVFAEENATSPSTDLRGLPATRVDGILLADSAPEGNPASAFAHFRELQRLLGEREATGAPVTLELAGILRHGTLRVEVNATATRTLGNVTVHIVLFEDGVNGQRFVVVGEDVAPESGELPLAFSRDIQAIGDASKLGVVAYVEVQESVATFQRGEVVQSAVWSVGQSSTTRQSTKSVLVEHATASWCEPCRPSDEAIALLAGAGATPRSSYALAPTPLAIAGLVAGAAIGIVLLRRRPA